MKSANVGDFQIRKLSPNSWIAEELTTIGNPACSVTQWQEIGKFPTLKLVDEKVDTVSDLASGEISMGTEGAVR